MPKWHRFDSERGHRIALKIAKIIVNTQLQGAINISAAVWPTRSVIVQGKLFAFSLLLCFNEPDNINITIRSFTVSITFNTN